MTDAHSEMKALRKIIQQVHDFSTQHWKTYEDIDGDKLDQKTRDAYDNLISKYPPIESEELSHRLFESIKPRNLNLYLDGGGRLYLPPLDEDPEFVASLSLECDLKAATMSIRIEMQRILEDSMCGIGYRLELGTGEHGYYHLTLASKRPSREGGGDIMGCPPWLPTNIPRIPTSAKCPVALFVSVLIGLYGFRGYLKLLTKLEEPIDKQCLLGLEHIFAMKQ
jgi:hypothetical protein